MVYLFNFKAMGDKLIVFGFNISFTNSGSTWNTTSNINRAMFVKILYNYERGVRYFDQVDFHPSGTIMEFPGLEMLINTGTR